MFLPILLTLIQNRTTHFVYPFFLRLSLLLILMFPCSCRNHVVCVHSWWSSCSYCSSWGTFYQTFESSWRNSSNLQTFTMIMESKVLFTIMILNVNVETVWMLLHVTVYMLANWLESKTVPWKLSQVKYFIKLSYVTHSSYLIFCKQV